MADQQRNPELQHDQRRPPVKQNLRQPQHEPHAKSDMPDHQIYQSTGHLAKLLPSGTVFFFQLLAPILAKQGHCSDMSRMMTGGLVVLCALSCFVLSFTDCFRDDEGKIRYGFATFKGLWVLDGGATLDPVAGVDYRMQFTDFVHAIVSAMIFVAIALFDQNVLSCFYPIASKDTKQLLTTLPVAIGVIGSFLSVNFPTTRQGIGLGPSLYQH